jgi:hypothetical protein
VSAAVDGLLALAGDVDAIEDGRRQVLDGDGVRGDCVLWAVEEARATARAEQEGEDGADHRSIFAYM